MCIVMYRGDVFLSGLQNDSDSDDDNGPTVKRPTVSKNYGTGKSNYYLCANLCRKVEG